MDTLLFQRSGPVASITLNRPEKGNRMTIEMVLELTRLLAEVGADPEVKAVVLRGNGADFCGGRDPGPPPEGPPPSALAIRSNLITPILTVYEAIRRVPVPVVSVVRGGAIGFGCALACVCDVTIASDQARFALPELRSGIPPTLAISAVMDKVLVKALAYMVLSTEEIDAKTALQIGLVSRVVPQPALDSEMDRFVGQLCQRSQAALAAVKQYLLQARRMDPEGAAGFGGNLLASVLSSQ